MDELPWRRLALRSRLALAEDEPFLRLIWALNAMQTGRADAARHLFRGGAPIGAESEGILGPHAIYPWELETIINELLTTPKHQLYRTFDSRSWQSATEVVNALRNLENAEYGARRHELNIYREMGRIGARQFDWQRGYFTLPELYRSAFIYGQGECAAYLRESVGVSVADLSFIGFALMSVYFGSSVIRPADDLALLHQLGVAPAALNIVLHLLARPLADLRLEAAAIRNEHDPTAYRPSVLRRYPCVLVGPGHRRMLAPLPELIANRLTSGLFYDVIGGGGPVRDDYGRRFESYSHDLLSEMLPGLHFEREWPYQTPGGRFDSPDIVMADADDTIGLVIECKASRMSVAARFGEDPSDERGYQEIARGIFQVWRFFAHCRRGITGRTTAPGAKGVILTLDDWLTARSSMIDQLLTRANALADRDGGIEPEDRRPVAFCSISEFEIALKTATEQSFLTAIEIATGERRGWVFFALHDEVDVPKTAPKTYPFAERVGELLPWYEQIGENPE